MVLLMMAGKIESRVKIESTPPHSSLALRTREDKGGAALPGHASRGRHDRRRCYAPTDVTFGDRTPSTAIHYPIHLRLAADARHQRKSVEDLPAPQKKRILKPPSDD